MTKQERDYLEYCLQSVPFKDKDNWYFWIIDHLIEQGYGNPDLKEAITQANKNYKPVLTTKVL